MEEEVKNEEVKNVKKSCNSGVGTFFFLVVVVSIIVASIICGILEYNYYMEARIGNLQRQIDELKEINTQMESNYNDALNSNIEFEETTEDTTENTTVENTTAENTVAENTVVENAVTNNTTAENVVNTIE